MCVKCQAINFTIDTKDFEPELKRVAKLLYNGKLKPEDLDKGMISKIARELMGAVTSGYGKVETLKDASFIKKLEENIYVFSGFKNYQELKEVSLLLLDGKGSYKSFNDFYTDVKKIDHTYNEVYLQAEYNTALGSAQSAASWNDYENAGVKTLTYQTAGDSRVREEHAILDGITLPVTDPFWNTYYPPNGWSCRCDTAPGEEDQIVRVNGTDLPVLPAMFKNNVGKSAVIFPDTHPYFNVSEIVKPEIIKKAREILSAKKKAAVPEFTPGNISDYEKKTGVNIDKNIFSYLKKPTELRSRKQGAHYQPLLNYVNLPVDQRALRSKWSAERVVYHEFGHAIDFHHGLYKLDAVKDLIAKYKTAYAGKFRILHQELETRLNAAFVARDFDTAEKIGALADTIMSINSNYGFGHTKKYFKIPGRSENEFLAHMFENRFSGNEIFRELAGDLYEDMLKLSEELLN